ncbi:MAG: hypothetical protein QXP70_02980 [Methanomassiliicoccales archaeon]
MIIRASGRARGTAKQLFDWWSDYQDGWVENQGNMRVYRKVGRNEKGELVLEDHFSRPLHFKDITIVDLDPSHMKINFSSESSIWSNRGEYVFRDEGEGCVAEVNVDITPKGLLLLLFLLPGGKRWFKRQFTDDLVGHLREFERDMLK